MELARPPEECRVSLHGPYARAYVGVGTPAEIVECYETLGTVVLRHKLQRVLVVGIGAEHSHAHLGARDVVMAMHEVGLPTGFKIAFVPRSDATLNGYRHAEFEARQRGIRAAVFKDEDEAVKWLTENEPH